MPADPRLIPDLMPTDEMREWIEFYGTAVERLGGCLAECKAALGKGQFGVAVHCLNQAMVTRSIVAKGIDEARSQLATGGE
jgi:hypothetical protein